MVVFQYQLTTGLWFPLDPVVVGILKHLKIFIHQLRLALYMWVCKMTKVTPSPERFAYTHQVHKQPRTVTGISASSGEEVKRKGTSGA